MSGKIIFCKTKHIQLPPETEKILQGLGDFMAFDCTNDFQALKSFTTLSGKNNDAQLIFIGADYRNNKEFGQFIKQLPIISQCIWVDFENVEGEMPSATGIFSKIHKDDLNKPLLLKFLIAAFDKNRSSGIKSFLKEGATIYTQSLTNPYSLGTTLDPCNLLAQKHLEKNKAVSFWSAINALVSDAFILTNAKSSNGGRIEVQAGADDDIVSASVKFPFDYPDMESLNKRIIYNKGSEISPWLISREFSNFIEIRAYAENKSIEIAAVFLKEESDQSMAKPVLLRQISVLAIEDPSQVSKYTFQSFSAVEKIQTSVGKKGGFKKNNTQKVQKLNGDGNPEPVESVVKGVTQVIDDGIVTIKEGRASADTVNIIKSSPATTEIQAKVRQLEITIQQKEELLAKLNKENAEIKESMKKGVVNNVTNNVEKDKGAALYQSKIEGLETTLKQREELIAKLNKEVAEINDPMKRGVVANVVDSQKTGLAQNVSRLEGEVKEYEKREKEFMSMVDKAIQAKDKAIKEVKTLESKLEAAVSKGVAQAKTLQKQLDEATKQKQALTKKLAEASPGKKAA